MSRNEPDPHQFTELSHFEIDAEAVRLLGREFCLRRGVVVLGSVPAEDSDAVTVGLVRPGDAATVEAVEDALRRPIEVVRLHQHEVETAVAVGYPTGRHRGTGDEPLRLQPVHRISYQPDRAVRRLVHEAIAQAITLGASDVHFESYRGDVDVRLRVDGVLRQVSTPISSEHVPAAISYLKVLAGLDIAERRRAQDGRVLAIFEEPDRDPREIDLRLSVLPGPHGEDAVVRVLDSGAPDLGFDALGMEADTARAFGDAVASPEGMVLITGPTGSGKTTTLYAAIRTVNHDGNKLLTVENPIEYELPKANQKQVGPTMGFSDYARAFLRQDPDILMIGEIRDEETAALAVRAAQTGHLVLSTLHTRDAVGAVPRLETLAVERAMMADALLAVLAQRLLRRLCVECRRPAPADAALLRRLGLEGRELEAFEPVGCDACLDGYRGRVGVFELFTIDGAAAHRMARGRPPHVLRREAQSGGMRTLLDDALVKVERGVTSLAEVARHVPYSLDREPG